MTVPWAAIPAMSPAPATQPARTVEPGSRADEQAADEPVWAVVAVRRAPVWCISVVAVRANRSRPNRDTDRTNTHTHVNLRLSQAQRKRHHRQKRQILCVFHTHLLIPFTLLSTATYWNSLGRQKLRVSRWLIWAKVVDFNHLRTTGPPTA